MGSHQAGQEQQEPVPASAAEAPDCKRRRRGHDAPKPDVSNSAAGANVEVDIPQARATLDPNEYQDRPSAPLARELSCALCGELLKEAMTALECGHTYCYDCIEARVDIGGNHNSCPVRGCATVLGPNPFDHHRLVYDTLLDGLVAKIFPRPELDAALSKRRAEREEATRQARAAVNVCGGGGVNGSRGGGGARRRSASPEHEPAARGKAGGPGGAAKHAARKEEQEEEDAMEEGDGGSRLHSPSGRCGPRRRGH